MGAWVHLRLKGLSKSGHCAARADHTADLEGLISHHRHNGCQQVHLVFVIQGTGGYNLVQETHFE